MSNFKLLIDNLCNLPSETEYVEFKESYSEPDKEGKDICALANSATLHDVKYAYKVWGISDDAHEVVGTKFSPRTTKKGNQDLEIYLRSMLSSNANFEFEEAEVYGKHVVVLKISPATNSPVRYQSIAYIRSGSSTQKLEQGSLREAELWRKAARSVYERQTALDGLELENALQLLNFDAYFKMLGQAAPSNSEAIAHMLEVDKIIEHSTDGYAITNLGAILLAANFQDFPALRRKAIRIVKYTGDGRISIEKNMTFEEGYATAFEQAFLYLMAAIPSAEPIEGALRKSKPKFPAIAVRELLANSIVHQDLQATGTSPLIEVFDSRIEVTNPGAPLIEPKRIVNDPPQSRNESLAALMRRMGICEEAGSGWDKIVSSCEEAHLPAPVIETANETTRVILYGHREFKTLTPDERADACYWHVCVRFASRDYASNQSLRERFGLKESNSAQVSRLIKSCIDKGLIKLSDPDASPKYRRYIPAWA